MLPVLFKLVHFLFVYGGIFLVLWILLIGFQWLMSRGGAPTEESGQIMYRLRPGMKILSYGFVFVGLYLLFRTWPDRQNHALCGIEIGFGLLCVMGGTFILSTRMVVDDVGLHYFRWPNKQTTISWSALDHYEVLQNSQAMAITYFFRSANGENSIGVTDIAYDLADLMARVQAHLPLREEPYKRHYWYGG